MYPQMRVVSRICSLSPPAQPNDAAGVHVIYPHLLPPVGRCIWITTLMSLYALGEGPASSGLVAAAGGAWWLTYSTESSHTLQHSYSLSPPLNDVYN